MTGPLSVGDLTVRVLSDGTFGLDGGAVFGVVPKPLWCHALPADDRNRVRLGLNCLLVEGDDGVVLVDTGLGERLSAKEREMLAIERPADGGLPAALAAAGRTPEDVDVVVLSHLHFDHAGGALRAGPDGLVPTFPNARHVIQRREWEDAHRPHARNRASYRRDDFAALESSGRLDLVEGAAEVAPGVSVARTPGHCPGMQVVRVESRGASLVFPSDLVPTRAHLRSAWTMAFDLDVTATVREKRALLDRALAEDSIVCFDHDADEPLVRLRQVERDGRRHVEAVPVPRHEAA